MRLTSHTHNYFMTINLEGVDLRTTLELKCGTIIMINIYLNMDKKKGQVVKTLGVVGLAQVTKNHIKNRQNTMNDKWHEAHDLFNGLSGFAWSPITKRFEAEDKIKGLTSRQIYCAFHIHNDTIDFNDKFDETTMNDPNIENFNGM
ncbi:hypothetical protein CR513_62811, partial [Mucuna pruriens]